MFSWLNRRRKERKGCSTLPFCGISIKLVGHVAQLPPITDQVLYNNRPKVTLQMKNTAVPEIPNGCDV